MKKLLIFLGISIWFILLSCNRIDSKNFDFAGFLEDNKKEIIKEIGDRWEADTAFIQFIGFSSVQEYPGDEATVKMNAEVNPIGRYTEKFYDHYNLKYPIIIVYAKRHNVISGNTFDESGISSSDMVDYSNGVGRSDAANLHSLGNYTSESYEYSDFYLAYIDGEFKMLSKGYEEDRDGIYFFDIMISDKGVMANEYLKATNKVGFFVKGKEQIEMIDPSSFYRVQNMFVKSAASRNLDVLQGLKKVEEEQMRMRLDSIAHAQNYIQHQDSIGK